MGVSNDFLFIFPFYQPVPMLGYQELMGPEEGPPTSEHGSKPDLKGWREFAWREGKALGRGNRVCKCVRKEAAGVDKEQNLHALDYRREVSSLYGKQDAGPVRTLPAKLRGGMYPAAGGSHGRDLS
jgi:hypothetical protein